jgi:hypothetical protein
MDKANSGKECKDRPLQGSSGCSVPTPAVPTQGSYYRLTNRRLKYVHCQSNALVMYVRGLHGPKLLECWASPWLRKAVTVTSPRWPGLNSSQVRVGLVVDKMTLEEVSLLILRRSPVTSIPPVFQTPSFINHRIYRTGVAS